MRDAECVSFLQWALPQLEMRWAGFRRVRRQVRRRIAARLETLGLEDTYAYRVHLETHPAEWRVLDGLCRVTVSRFYRNRGVFRFLFEVALPELRDRAFARGDDTLRVWSIGCASGEEPCSIAIGWELLLEGAHSPVGLEILATDADAHMLERARDAEYPGSSLRDLPVEWREAAFEPTRTGTHRLRRRFHERVSFRQEDVRQAMPDGSFDLVLCRNLVFTYFAESVQQRVLGGIRERLAPGGGLVLGHHETLPAGVAGFALWDAKQSVFRRA